MLQASPRTSAARGAGVGTVGCLTNNRPEAPERANAARRDEVPHLPTGRFWAQVRVWIQDLQGAWGRCAPLFRPPKRSRAGRAAIGEVRTRRSGSGNKNGASEWVRWGYAGAAPPLRRPPTGPWAHPWVLRAGSRHHCAGCSGRGRGRTCARRGLREHGGLVSTSITCQRPAPRCLLLRGWRPQLSR